MYGRPFVQASTRACGCWLVGLVAVAAVGLPLILASGALAFGEPSDFKTCPVAFLNEPAVSGVCAHNETTGGQITIGKSTVLIANNPDTVDLGAYTPGGGFSETAQNALMVPSNGQMFGGPAQVVPGGLLGLPANGAPTGVTASLELAGPTTPGAVVDPTATTYFYTPFNALTYGSGTVLQVPVKVQLNNALLGPSCFIGSNSDPIVLSLAATAASNPTLSFLHNFNEIVVTGLVLGDSTFVAPGASGCGPVGALDKQVDKELRLPSPSGRNNATLDVNAGIAETCVAEGTC